MLSPSQHHHPICITVIWRFQGSLRNKFLIYQLVHFLLSHLPSFRRTIKKRLSPNVTVELLLHLQEGWEGNTRQGTTSIRKYLLRRYNVPALLWAWQGYLKSNLNPQPQRAGSALGKGVTQTIQS